MTVTAQMGGHPVVWDEQQGLWLYEGSGEVAPSPDMPCRKCGLVPIPVAVVIPAEGSCTGESRVAVKSVDACIADLVRRLNAGATEPVTRGSCCGHGDEEGSILLCDGRTLVLR